MGDGSKLPSFSFFGHLATKSSDNAINSFVFTYTMFFYPPPQIPSVSCALKNACYILSQS
jgi:hypothetical protein